jgi:predicted nuclease of restriction endonuclease-like (RecB) superfamily
MENGFILITVQYTQNNGIRANLLCVNSPQKNILKLRLNIQHNEGLAEIQIFNDLFNIIDCRRNILKRVANSELLTLFWNIGKELNFLFNNKIETQTSGITLKGISKNLAIKYGPHFTSKSLNIMRKFAGTFPNFLNLQQHIHLISWEHVIVLMKLKRKSEIEFYLTLKIKQGLSVKELKREIELNKNRNTINSTLNQEPIINDIRKNKKNLEGPTMNFEMLSKNEKAKPNLFKKSRNSVLRHLLEPIKQEEKSPDNLIDKSIIDLIEEYRRQQNIFLNANFNLLLWEVGNRICQETILNKPTSEVHSIIKRVSAHFKQEGKVFSQDQLHHMRQFADRFPSFEEGLQISYCVSWEHIVALSSLQDLNQILLYIEVVIETGINANELKRLISNNSIVDSLVLKHKTPQLLLERKAYKKKISSKNAPNSKINVNRIDFAINHEKKFFQSVFDNHFFIDFVSKEK